MKKKILTKHILMALTMAAMVPIGQAWAWEVSEDGKTLTSSENETLDLIKESPVKGTKLSQFTTIKIDHTANLAQRDFAAVITGTNSTVNLDQTNFYITVNKKEQNENADGLHITGNNTNVTIGDFSGHIQAANSDGISIGNEAGGSNVLNVGSIGQNGGLTVDHGNGIRAGAVSDKYVSGTGYQSVINVAGATNITINGGEVTSSVTLSNEQVDGMIGNRYVSVPIIPGILYQDIYVKDQLRTITVSAGYMPAAVYAGNDMYDFTCEASKLVEGAEGWKWASSLFDNMSMHLGNAAAGQGNIVLHDTNLTIQKSDDGKEGGYGLFAGKNGHIQVNGNLTITSEAAHSYGIAAKNANLIYGDSLSIEAETDGLLTMVGSSITSNLEDYPLDTSKNTHGTSVMLGEGKDVSISMQGDNSYAMYAEGVDNKGTQVSITGKELNTLYAVGDMLVENGGSIDLGTTGEKTDNNGNPWGAYQLGAVIASGTNKVSDTDIKKSTYSLSSANANYISSESVIDHAGDLGENAPKINSALYAEHGGQIDLGGSFNYIAADYSGEGSENYSRRAVWAYDTADINITGGVQIKADYSAQDDPTGKNSTNMAIVAGTAIGLDEDTVNNTTNLDRAVVTVNYDSESAITGDIVSAYAGQVDIQKREDAAENAKINITGNLLAGNNGILNVDLGNGGVLEGRADDYGDAGSGESSGHGTTFFYPAFSSDIYKGGAVNLTMGAGSTWNVTGQSWITSITTADSGSTPVIDLVSANTDRNKTAHALTIYKMNGDAVFNMSLDGDRTVSDMLYMKKANGEYIVNLKEAVGVDDMFASMGSDGKTFTGLRFATVGADSDVSFHVFAKDTGMQNIEYTVETDKYKENEENAAYDSTDGTGAANEQKPGTNMVEGFFNSKGTPPTDSGEESANGQIMLLAAGDEAAGTSTATTETTNFKLIGIKGTELSDAGKTVVNMSKVNYSNAVYMDRLNKRMGEARYIDGDDGLWVRMRHDRIGKDNAFRSMNTMMELGYDRKVQSQKNGEHRWGVAFDYMRGTADYTNVMGSGDVRRAGVWLYDTWLGDKGHYTDYVVKYGHLSNDFDIYAQSSGNKISGDYNNDVWSASAEYGRKKDIGNDWYFEPQAQLQYAYVTSADYTTSQDTKVHLDSIDSLIGRVGFRLGRDTDEANTVYFKADVLHEFLGGQSIRAMDTTTNGVLTTTYENEGTWYDVGFGFSHRMGKDSYMFLDVEHSFGNDNEDTYQINIGLNRAF